MDAPRLPSAFPLLAAAPNGMSWSTPDQIGGLTCEEI
jgi:hypothetical protein